MAYFPKALMPLTSKADFSGSSGFSGSNLISAADYNKHDQELLAIEQFLGVNGGFPRLGLNKDVARDDGQPVSGGAAAGGAGSPEQALLAANGGQNLLNQIAKLTDQLNVFVDGGIASSSGSTQTGGRIIFPEDSFFCYLTGVPSAGDTTIAVNSTAGFPSSGVISILNDVQQAVVPGAVSTTTPPSSKKNPPPPPTRGPILERVAGGLSNVEWIQYSGKNSTQFLNCQRGYLGTYAGPHAGAFEQVSVTGTTSNNLQNFCINLSFGTTVCQRQNPAWRFRTIYSFPLFNVTGTLSQVTTAIRLGASQFRIFPTFNQSDYNQAVANARYVGATLGGGSIAEFTSKGALFLKSLTRTDGKLTQTEASRFVQAGLSNGITSIGGASAAIIHVTKGPGNFGVAGLGIPVFCGRMAVDYAVGDVTRADASTMSAIQLIQTADGRAIATILKSTKRDETLQGVVNYQTYIVASPRTSQERGQG